MSHETGLGLSYGLMIVLRGTGLTMAPDDAGLGQLGIGELSLLERLAAGVDALPDAIRQIAASTGTAAARLEEVHAALRAQGALQTTPGTRESVRAPAALGATPLADGHEFAVPVPLVFGLSPQGFECLDHAGARLVVLSAAELAAVAELRVPRSTHDAWSRHERACAGAALSEAGFSTLVERLVAAGLCASQDPGSSKAAGRSRANRAWAAALQNLNRVDDAVVRRLNEHENAVAAGSEGRDRVAVIGVHPAGVCPPLAIGMVLAYAQAHDGGRLERHFDFFPRWVIRKESKVFQSATTKPAIYLFSNYLWSSESNFELSAEVKRRSAGSLVIHGGPDTPKYPDDTRQFFADHPEVDIAVRGEGEATMADLLDALSTIELDGAPPDLACLRDIQGIAFRDRGEVVRTADRERIADVDLIPSPYLTGLLDAYGEAVEGTAIIETNRGCPYGCTFCDWGSATLSRIRKFDIQRVFDELEWCAQHGVTRVWVADANFGIFERDVAIAEKVAELKNRYGCPTMFSTNYAKNTVKHLKPIVKVMADAGILTQGLLSLQTMDDDTLSTIKRTNIKLEKYEDLAKEFREAGLPLFVDLMLGLPGATMASFRNDLQQCIDREVSAKIFPTRMLVNSPMNDPAYREEHQIETEVAPGTREPLVVSTSTFTRADHAAMLKLREVYLMCENHGLLRQVSRFVRQESGIREVDFYEAFCRAALTDRNRFPAAAFVFDQGASLMVPPVSWRLFVDEVRTYLTYDVGLPADSALDTVITVQHALIPARGRQFPEVLDLAHDVGAWHAAIVDAKDRGDLTDWPMLVPRLRDLPPREFVIDDPHQVCTLNIGSAVDGDAYSDWELRSPVSRSMPASHMGV